MKLMAAYCEGYSFSCLNTIQKEEYNFRADVWAYKREVLCFDRFMIRGLNACLGEWKLICIGHNILRLKWYELTRDETKQVMLKKLSSKQNKILK